MNDPIIIVGSGLAGFSLAREIRKRDKEIPLTLISQDSACFYSKPTLSNALANNKNTDTLIIKTCAQMAEELGAKLLPHTTVSAIDPHRKIVVTAEKEHAYRDVVLAIGATPFIPEIKGNAMDKILYVNHLADYARFQTSLHNKKSVVILGAGLIGCEFATDLVTTGKYHVSLIDTADWPLSRLLPVSAGQFLAGKLMLAGINLHMGRRVDRIDYTDNQFTIQLDNGIVLNPDIVLSAIGLRPNLALAQAADLHTKRGIVVNRYLQTSSEHIYSLGDCAEVAGLLLPFVLPIMHAARALSATLTGEKTQLVYPAMPITVKTPICPTIIAPPPLDSIGTWQIETSIEGIEARFLDQQNTLLGFALLGSAVKERQRLSPLLPSTLQ